MTEEQASLARSLAATGDFDNHVYRCIFYNVVVLKSQQLALVVRLGFAEFPTIPNEANVVRVLADLRASRLLQVPDGAIVIHFFDDFLLSLKGLDKDILVQSHVDFSRVVFVLKVLLVFFNNDKNPAPPLIKQCDYNI